MNLPVHLKKLIARIHSPWVHAVVGSALVLCSTVATGYWLYENQNEADRLRAEVSTRAGQIDRSERRRDVGDLVATLANIQHFGARDVDPRLRQAVDNVTIANLYEATARMAEAAGNESSDLVEALRARDRARAGDPRGIDELYTQMQRFLSAVGKYQGTLRSEIDRRERRLRALERSRNWLYFAGLVLQITGLVFLLLKEVPVSLGEPVNKGDAA